MNKFFSKIAIGIASFAMVVGVGVGIANNKANPVFAETAIMAPGTNSEACTVNGHDGIKAGTSKKSGDMTITVGAGATNLTLYSAAWKGAKVSLNISGATVSPSSISLKADDGISNNSPFTLNGNESDFKFELELSNITSETAIKFAGSGRFVVWSASYQTGGGTGDDDPIALADPNPQYDDETKLVSWTTDSNASKYQIKVDSNSYEDIETTTYDASNLTVGEEHTISIKAVGDETKYTSSEGSVKFTPTMYETHRKFTVTGTRAVEEVGDIITDAVASYSQTYTTKSQITGGNSATLSITGLTKKVSINKLVLSMRSNKSSGAGSVSVTVDGKETFIAGTSKEAGVPFNQFGDNDAYSDTYKNITWDNLSFIAKSSIEIKIEATEKSLYIESFNIFFTEEENNDYVSALSVTPNTWTGYTTTLLKVEDFKVSVTTGETEGSTADYVFLGIGHMDGDEFVARNERFTEGYPQVTDTRLYWKAKYPTAVGGSTYLYTYVTLNVSQDTLKSVQISKDMEKLSYYTTDRWDFRGLESTAVYASGTTQDVTYRADYTFYSDAGLTEEVKAPADLGVGNNKTVYVKATYEGVSNTEGYAQLVDVSYEHGCLITDPLTADEAIGIGSKFGNNGETEPQYYIRGIVISIETNQLDQEGNAKYATFDLEESNKDFKFTAYKIAPNENCKNYEDLIVGAEVLLRCRIKNYLNTTIENGSLGELVSIKYTKPELTGITLNETSLILALGEKFTLKASAKPVGAELDKVVWSSSDDKVASVVDGVITTNTAGTATITAEANGFKATCKVDVYNDATMKYGGGDTINMDGKSNNAKVVGLEENMFAVDATKGDSSALPGLNANGEIRLYKDNKSKSEGSSFTVTIDSKHMIAAIKVNFKDGAQNATVYAGNKEVTSEDESLYEINAASFTIKDTGTDQVKIDSIKIFYRDINAKETISVLNTQTSLAYNYDVDGEGNFTYSNVVMRFGAKISKDLWNELDTDKHAITGFGVMIADGEMIKSDAEFAEAIENNFVTPSIESTNVEDNIAIDYFVPVANMETTIGVEGDNYFWNLRFSVDATKMNKMYSAIAYIKVGDEYVVLKMAKESVETLALDYLVNRGCDETTAGGSLQAIVDNAK